MAMLTLGCQALQDANRKAAAYPSPMLTFGDRLRMARNARGKTQELIADEIGVTKASVSAWENNRDTPSFAYLEKIRYAFGVPLDLLICNDLANLEGVKRYLGVGDEPPPAYAPEEPPRPQTSSELALLLRYRAMTPARQRALLDLLRPESD